MQLAQRPQEAEVQPCKQKEADELALATEDSTLLKNLRSEEQKTKNRRSCLKIPNLMDGPSKWLRMKLFQLPEFSSKAATRDRQEK